MLTSSTIALRSGWIVSLALAACLSNITLAQRPGRKAKATPAPIDEELKTKDGLRLACRYYPGADSKQTIPIIMLHAWKGSMGDFDKFALYLQSPEGGGHAVLVPDLRGHGRSTELKRRGDAKPRKISAERMRRDEFEQMVKYDLETLKRYLLVRHNEGELNIDGLVVIGAKLGGLVALHWTARDWSWPQLPGVKQGQDVRAVVILTPVVGFKGITSLTPFEQSNLREHISLLVLYGENDTKVSSAVRRIANPLKRVRQMDFDSAEETINKKSFYVEGLDTSLQGTDLLTDDHLPTAQGIKVFIDRRVKDRMGEHFPWKSRQRPIP